ncbi:hypothetical protein Pla52o_46230 [Novipirellula galeiformis]|uniref:Uncharacterized protein n=1 Tax=Novipirellula galeiformis TaxID=2528004 RepID=A0A5C6CBA8_9BACT|nr:hypothetical protein [Novipirellula galeiformis]TWU20109.1 hypothetical protein Pla52o_46230 [Novipirellula galeiformis]
MTSTTNATTFLTAILGLALVGCGDPTSSTVDTVSSSYLLAIEPEGAITPTAFKEAVTSEGGAAAAAGGVVLAGKIDAGDLDPFEKGKATFVLSELPDAEHAAGDPDHANNCPFCKRKLKNAPKVVVRFVDPSGALIAQDAQAMLGVKKGDSVVVKGVAEYQEPINMIQINAESIYRR